FAQFFLDGGISNGRSVLPDGWLKEATAPRLIGGKQVDYGYMWWSCPDSDGTFTDGAFTARGIFGQYIYINPAQRVVIVTLSQRSKPRFAEGIVDNDFFNSVAATLR
ncbi:serine hydrolase, partial [Steroidobacter sp.]|uniref:serine hydrolase n=1 Tax=Steroidobacter sp. TaxID=1978227 RepID=UPI001A4C71B8